jgi:hypothetical protein
MDLISRLTLVLSCAMNFKNYPHDEQLCNLKIESSKLSSWSHVLIPLPVSHTTDDLIFEWDPTVIQSFSFSFSFSFSLWSIIAYANKSLLTNH